jgi:hypothetical protein
MRCIHECVSGGKTIEESIMPINLNGLPALVGSAESAAGAATNGLTGDATAAQLTQANLAITKYNIIASMVNSVIEKDGQAKLAPSRR